MRPLTNGRKKGFVRSVRRLDGRVSLAADWRRSGGPLATGKRKRAVLVKRPNEKGAVLAGGAFGFRAGSEAYFSLVASCSRALSIIGSDLAPSSLWASTPSAIWAARSAAAGL